MAISQKFRDVRRNLTAVKRDLKAMGLKAAGLKPTCPRRARRGQGATAKRLTRLIEKAGYRPIASTIEFFCLCFVCVESGPRGDAQRS